MYDMRTERLKLERQYGKTIFPVGSEESKLWNAAFDADLAANKTAIYESPMAKLAVAEHRQPFGWGATAAQFVFGGKVLPMTHYLNSSYPLLPPTPEQQAELKAFFQMQDQVSKETLAKLYVEKNKLVREDATDNFRWYAASHDMEMADLPYSFRMAVYGVLTRE
jgi:hypothetical protein